MHGGLSLACHASSGRNPFYLSSCRFASFRSLFRPPHLYPLIREPATNLSSYFRLFFISLRLQRFQSLLPATAFALHTQSFSTLAWLTLSLAGGELTEPTLLLWRQAQAASLRSILSSSLSSPSSSSSSIDDRALHETLRLSLPDILSIHPKLLSSSHPASSYSPTRTVASLLSSQDIVQILRTLFLLTCPPKGDDSLASSSPSFSVPLTSPSSVLPRLSSRHRATLASQIASALSCSIPQSKEREAALVCMGVLGVLGSTRDAEPESRDRARASVVVEEGLKGLRRPVGRAGHMLMRAKKGGRGEGQGVVRSQREDEPLDASQTSTQLEIEIDDLARFLLSYHSLLMSSGQASISVPSSTTSSSPSTASSGNLALVRPTLDGPSVLAQTLHLRSLLASPSFAFVSPSMTTLTPDHHHHPYLGHEPSARGGGGRAYENTQVDDSTPTSRSSAF